MWALASASLAVALLPLLPARAQEIDANIYAKLFQVNKPCWEEISAQLKDLPKGARVLDVGAGPGEPSVTIATERKDLQVLCTDKQEAMLEKARKRAHGLPNIDFQAMGVEDLSALESETFDAVTGSYVLMFVDVLKSLSEVARVLKPNGLIVMSVWKDLPMYTMTRSIFEKVAAAHDLKEAPPFPINPMALSPTEHNTKGNIQDSLIEPIGLKVHNQHDISYDFPIDDLDAACSSASILSGPALPELVQQTGVAQADLEREFCDKLKGVIAARPDWQRDNGRISFGKGVATIYVLERLRKKDEL